MDSRTGTGAARRWWQLAAVGTAVFCVVGDAAPTPAPVAVSTLMRRDLADFPGREALMLTVDYAPGASSQPHRHDAEVFVYVLEGAVVMQLAGQPRQTLGPGETFHEGPADVHVSSANASATAPAKILVVMLKDKGRPVSQPASAP